MNSLFLFSLSPKICSQILASPSWFLASKPFPPKACAKFSYFVSGFKWVTPYVLGSPTSSSVPLQMPLLLMMKITAPILQRVRVSHYIPLKPKALSPITDTAQSQGCVERAEITAGRPIPMVPKVAASSLRLGSSCSKTVRPMSMVLAPSPMRMVSLGMYFLMTEQEEQQVMGTTVSAISSSFNCLFFNAFLFSFATHSLQLTLPLILLFSSLTENCSSPISLAQASTLCPISQAQISAWINLTSLLKRGGSPK